MLLHRVRYCANLLVILVVIAVMEILAIGSAIPPETDPIDT